MEYKTVKFWEDILDQFVKDDKITLLCQIDNFFDFWTDSSNCYYIKTKAKEFLIQTKRNKVQIGNWFLFVTGVEIYRNIRIEFLKWLINDLKSVQTI